MAAKRCAGHPMFRASANDLLGSDKAILKEFQSEFGTIEPLQELVSFDIFVWEQERSRLSSIKKKKKKRKRSSTKI